MAHTNTFATALTSASNIVLNRNGGEMLSTSGDWRLDAFTNLNKDTCVLDIRSKITEMINEAKRCDDSGEYIADIFRIWVHKRHAREGEKEKILSYRYFLELYEFYPETCVALARSSLFGEIGYWKDYYLIWGLINKMEMDDRSRYNKYDKLVRGFRHSVLTQRQSDLCKLKAYIGNEKLNTIDNMDLEQMLKDKSVEGEKLSVSYVGKYCVREKSSLNKELYWYIEDNGRLKRESHVSYMIRGSLKIKDGDDYTRFPCSKAVPFNTKRTYRNMNAKLNIVLNVPECFMCADRFGEMVPETFPSVFMKKNTKGLLNEKIKTSPTGYEEDTGNRHPYDEGRVALRQKMREMFTDPSKMNSSQVFPHEICYKAFYSTSTLEMDMFESMWQSKIIETKERLDETRLSIIGGMAKDTPQSMGSSDRIRLALSSGNFVGCADVSGSMEWADKPPNRPIDIAMGLTVFMSEIASPIFRNLALSFTTDPRIMNFSGLSLKDKLNKIKEYVGYSTNYEGLHRALIDLCVQNKVKDEDIPVIVVYTDGDFDSMDPNVGGGRWRTIHSKIVSMWVSAGYKKIPTMVYWNLNRDSMGVQEDKDHEGIMFLQGRSATNIKYILYGECAEEKVKMIDGVEVKVSSITPYEIFRKAMTQEYFADLEAIIRGSNEGLLQYYK